MILKAICAVPSRFGVMGSVFCSTGYKLVYISEEKSGRKGGIILAVCKREGYDCDISVVVRCTWRGRVTPPYISHGRCICLWLPNGSQWEWSIRPIV